MFKKKLWRSILHLNRKQVQTLTKVSKKFIDQEIQTENKLFFDEKNISAEEVKEAKVLS